MSLRTIRHRRQPRRSGRCAKRASTSARFLASRDAIGRWRSFVLTSSLTNLRFHFGWWQSCLHRQNRAHVKHADAAYTGPGDSEKKPDLPGTAVESLPRPKLELLRLVSALGLCTAPA